MYHNNLSQAYRAAGNLMQAEKSAKRTIKLDANIPEAYVNLGAIALEKNEFNSAITAYKKAVNLRENYIDALLGLGDSLVKSEKVDAGLKKYEEILAQQPDNVAAITRTGIALRKLNRVDEAIKHYKKHISRLPEEPDFYNNLSLLYQQKGNIAEAVICLRKLLEITPNDNVSRHLLNSFEGLKTITAPAEYVSDLFDNYAHSFESHLVNKLDYHVPELLAKEILGHTVKKNDLLFLDLGCGTGLMGVMLKNFCAYLSGVDFAPKMIEQTRIKGIYQELVVGDVLEFMNNKQDASYDVIAAADVFIYVGELKSVFSEAKRLLSSGGVFAFSIEDAADESSDYVLNDTGRYSHTKKYIHELQLKHDFIERACSSIQIRNENGKPVNGYLYVLSVV